MTVNRAISGKKKVPSLHATSGVKMIRRDKENKVGSKLDKVVVEDEQDITIVTDTAMVLSDQAILKAVQQKSQVFESGMMSDEVSPNLGVPAHGRNFSVNLPYTSKPTLHTNMSTFQASRKPSNLKLNNQPRSSILSSNASIKAGHQTQDMKPMMMTMQQ